MDNDQKLAFRHLTKRVALERQPITYRVASCELGITIQDAKALLQSFYDGQEAKERGVLATYCLSGTMQQNANQSDPAGGDDDEMQVDGSEESRERIETRVMLLVQESELQAAQTRFSSPPRVHIYALHAGPLASTSDLALHTLAIQSTDSAKSKWKEMPIGGYGDIVHPNGERRKATPGTLKGKGKAATTISTKSKTDTKESNTTKSNTLTSTSMKKSDSSNSKSSKAAAPAVKIGQPRGLFAPREPPPPPKVVPSKRKSTSPSKSKTDQVVDDEDEFDDGNDDDDMWDEEALKLAEETALNTGKGAGSKSNSPPKPKAAPPPTKKPQNNNNGGWGQKKEVAKSTQQKDIKNFFGKK